MSKRTGRKNTARHEGVAGPTLDCSGPLHAGTQLPLSAFNLRIDGRNPSAPRSYYKMCRRCDSRARAARAGKDPTKVQHSAFIDYQPAKKGPKRPKRRPRPEKPDEVRSAERIVAAHRQEVRASAQNHVYLMGVAGDRFAVKLGEAIDPAQRIADHQVSHARKLVLLGYFKTDIPRDADKVYLARFRHLKVRGEHVRPANEVLRLFGVSNSTFFRKTRDSLNREDA